MLLFVGSSVAQFHHERQHSVVLRAVERELSRLQQCPVQFLKLLQYDVVYLQVSARAAALAVHHTHQIAVPVYEFGLLLRRVAELFDVFALDASQRTVVCTYDILYLPHIKQVLGY